MKGFIGRGNLQLVLMKRRRTSHRVGWERAEASPSEGATGPTLPTESGAKQDVAQVGHPEFGAE